MRDIRKEKEVSKHRLWKPSGVHLFNIRRQEERTEWLWHDGALTGPAAPEPPTGGHLW